jgi:hypothetical protein
MDILAFTSPLLCMLRNPAIVNAFISVDPIAEGLMLR